MSSFREESMRTGHPRWDIAATPMPPWERSPRPEKVG
jgi:hypothetical protein